MTHDDTRPSPADMAAFSGARATSAPARALEAPLQIPADLREHLKALEAYRRAVEEIAKVDALIEQAQAKRATLAASVREAQQVMRATDPDRAKRPAPRTRMRPAGGAVAAVNDLLPATLGELVERTGLTRSQVKNALQRLKADGEVSPSPDGVWRPTTEGS